MIARLCGLLLFWSGSAVVVAEDGWIPFELQGGHIRIPSKVAGIQGESVLDTGAAGVAISDLVAEQAGLRVKRNTQVSVQGVTGTMQSVMYRKAPVHVFGADFEIKDLVGMGYRDDMQMLLGAPLLTLFVYQFDYPNQKLRALPHKAVNLKALSNIPSKRDSRGGRMPVLQVDLNGQEKLWLTMDTGNNGGLLINRKVAKKHGWLEQYAVEEGSIAGVTGQANTESFKLPRVKFGPFELENVKVVVPAQGVSMPPVEGYRIASKGLIGFDILKHFVVTVDYKIGKVHVALPE